MRRPRASRLQRHSRRIAPQIQFQLILPAQNYQGKYLQLGCGGYCGTDTLSTLAASYGCVPVTTGQFAAATGNEGHSGAVCAPGQTSTAADFCLTAAQVTTVNKLYDGPTASSGQLLCPGWELRGSEDNWVPWIVPASGPESASIDWGIASQTIKYLMAARTGR